MPLKSLMPAFSMPCTLPYEVSTVWKNVPSVAPFRPARTSRAASLGALCCASALPLPTAPAAIATPNPFRKSRRPGAASVVESALIAPPERSVVGELAYVKPHADTTRPAGLFMSCIERCTQASNLPLPVHEAHHGVAVARITNCGQVRAAGKNHDVRPVALTLDSAALQMRAIELACHHLYRKSDGGEVHAVRGCGRGIPTLAHILQCLGIPITRRAQVLGSRGFSRIRTLGIQRLVGGASAGIRI